MEVSFAILAAYAELSPDGKVAMLSGDLDTFLTPSQLPVTSGMPLYLIAKIVFPPSECGRDYPLVVEFIAPDGSIFQQSEKNLVVTTSPNNRPIKVGALLTIQHMTFPALGEYTIRLSIEGRELKRVPMYVQEVQPNV